MTEFTVLPDSERNNLPPRKYSGGTPTPEDLQSVRDGNTIFLPHTPENEKRVNAIRSVFHHDRKRNGETRLLTARQFTWQGQEGHLIWAYEPPTGPTED